MRETERIWKCSWLNVITQMNHCNEFGLYTSIFDCLLYKLDKTNITENRFQLAQLNNLFTRDIYSYTANNVKKLSGTRLMSHPTFKYQNECSLKNKYLNGMMLVLLLWGWIRMNSHESKWYYMWYPSTCHAYTDHT